MNRTCTMTYQGADWEIEYEAVEVNEIYVLGLYLANVKDCIDLLPLVSQQVEDIAQMEAERHAMDALIDQADHLIDMAKEGY